MHNNENNKQNNKDTQESIQTKMSLAVLHKLEVQKHTPIPKSYFVLRNVFMWSLAFFSLIFGAFSVSGLLFRVSNISHILPTPIRFEHFFHLFRLFPLFWILIFGLFVYVAYLEIRNTRQGYKYHLYWIIGSMCIMSTFLGVFLYYLGIGFILDKMASRFVPFSPDIELVQEEQFLNPEKGFLVGKVVKVQEGQEVFVLRDPRGFLWEILFSSGLTTEEKNMIQEGRKVGLQGIVSEFDKHMFDACKIRNIEMRGRGRFTVPSSKVSEFIEITIGTSSERKLMELRINGCEGVQPQKEIIPVN